MVQQHPMARKDFIDGLMCVVVRDEHEQTIKNRALKLLLFTGVLDDDVQRVRFALDNGARADEVLDSASKRILTNMGWTVPEIEPSPASLGVDSSSVQLQSSEEPYPHG